MDSSMVLGVLSFLRAYGKVFARACGKSCVGTQLEACRDVYRD